MTVDGFKYLWGRSKEPTVDQLHSNLIGACGMVLFCSQSELQISINSFSFLFSWAVIVHIHMNEKYDVKILCVLNLAHLRLFFNLPWAVQLFKSNIWLIKFLLLLFVSSCLKVSESSSEAKKPQPPQKNKRKQ